jgi:TetR/AcrR family tetracycline transcriptional repressor
MSSIMVLTREQIARAALELLDEEGLDSLTVRKVANKLGVQHGALYWHVKHKQALLDEVAEAILREEFGAVEEPVEPAGWEEWLLKLAGRLRKALLAHRDGAAVVATSQSKSTVTTLSAIGDKMVATLHKAGFDLKDAAVIYYTVVSYIFGLAVQEQGVSSYEAVKQEIENSGTAQQFPQFTRSKQAVFAASKTSEDIFKYGLQLILNGVKFDLLSPQ